ncbi:MAG TPA: DNA gyrase subunit A [Mycobacteriales bacterium]|jgi:DNA gyrase/topoisomerase IV subunit A|nr:DNA gyrase subunit A [Mycobacteriales bacterium]
MSEDDEVTKEQLHQRLEVLEAILVAAQRRADLFGIVDDSADPEDAQHRLVEQLALTKTGAAAVLNTPIRQLTRSEQVRVQAERDRIRARLW